MTRHELIDWLSGLLSDHPCKVGRKDIEAALEEYVAGERALADRLAEAMLDVARSCVGVGESSFGYFVGHKIVVTRNQLEALRTLLSEHAKARQEGR